MIEWMKHLFSVVNDVTQSIVWVENSAASGLEMMYDDTAGVSWRFTLRRPHTQTRRQVCRPHRISSQLSFSRAQRQERHETKARPSVHVMVYKESWKQKLETANGDIQPSITFHFCSLPLIFCSPHTSLLPAPRHQKGVQKSRKLWAPGHQSFCHILS